MGGVVKAVTSVAEFASNLSPGWGTIASLAFQGFSAIKSRKQGKKSVAASRGMAETQRKQEESRSRFSQAQAQRQRIQQQRKTRIAQQQAIGQQGNVLGQGGTSGFAGSVGSLGTQGANSIGDINVQQGFAQEQSGYNQSIASQQQNRDVANTKQAGWQNVENFGQSVADIFQIDYGTNKKND
jgi:hypothetical protein